MSAKVKAWTPVHMIFSSYKQSPQAVFHHRQPLSASLCSLLCMYIKFLQISLDDFKVTLKVIQIMIGTENPKMRCHHIAMELFSIVLLRNYFQTYLREQNIKTVSQSLNVIFKRKLYYEYINVLFKNFTL